MKNLLYYLIICILGVACSDSFDEDMYNLGDKAFYLSVSEEDIILTPTAQTKNIEIRTESSWEVEYNANWITVDKRSGSKGDVVSIKTTSNSSSDLRCAIITIRTKEIKSFEKIIKLSQESFAVDMGTSVKWAPCCAELWKEFNSSWPNWRYPTENETKELFDKCTLQWINGDLSNHATICEANYVTLTSQNGNVIRIPTHRTDVNSNPNFRFCFTLYDKFENYEKQCIGTSLNGVGYIINTHNGRAFCTILVCE